MNGWFYQDLKRIEVHDTEVCKSDFQALPQSEKVPPVERFSVDKSDKGSERCLELVCHLRDGKIFTHIINRAAYLLSDTGETIERIN